MTFNKILPKVLCGLILTLFACQTFAKPISASQNDDIQYSLNLKTIKVGVFAMPGYFNVDKGAFTGGYAYDYFQFLKRYAPWDYKYSKNFYKWSDMLSMLESGEVDMVPCVFKTPEREKDFAFSKYPMGVSSTIMTVKEGNKKYLLHDYKNWNGIKVGMLKGGTSRNDSFEKFAKNNKFTYTPVYYSTVEELLSDLNGGRKIDAAVTRDIRIIGDEWIYEKLDPSPIFIAVRKNDKALLAELDSAMNTVRDIFPTLHNDLRNQYLSSKHHVQQVAFTPEERAFIESANRSKTIFIAVMNPDRKPISYIEEGKYRGMLKDIADEVIRRTGLDIRFNTEITRKSYYEKSYTDEDVDIIFDFKYDFPRAEKLGLVLSKPYYNSAVSILYHKENDGKFKSLAFIEPSNEPYMYNAASLFSPDAKYVKCGSYREAIDLVATGECDALFLHTRSAEYAARTDPVGHLEVKLLPEMVNRFCVAVRDTHNHLLSSIIDKAVSSIDADFISMTQYNNSAPYENKISFEKILHRYFYIFIAIVAFIIIMLLCFIAYILRNRKIMIKHHRQIDREVVRWNAASKIAKIYNFTFNSKTREISGSKELSSFLPIKDGVVALAENWVYSEDIAGWRSAFNKLKSHKANDISFTHRTLKDGKFRYFHVFMCVDTQEENTVFGLVQEYTDFEEIRQEQENTKQLWQSCVDVTPSFFFIKDVNNDFKIVQCNNAYADFFGLTPSEIVGYSESELFGKKMTEFLDDDLSVVKSGKICRNKRTLLDKNNKLRHFSTTKVCSKNHNGDPIIIGMAVDETEDYEKQIEIQNLLDNWEVAAEVAGLVTYRINTKTFEIIGSTRLSDFWKIRYGKALPVKDVVIPEDIALCEKQYYAVASGEQKTAILDYRIKSDDGINYYRLFMRKDPNYQDSVTGLIQNITQFVMSQKRSDALNRLWHNLADTIPAILFIKDADDDYRYIYANNNLAKLLKCDVKDILGHFESEFMRREESERIRASDVAVMESGKRGDLYERLYDDDLVEHRFNSIKIPSVNEFGHRIMIQMTTDVTELEELSEIRKIISHIFENVFFSEDLKDGIQKTLKQICEFIGYSRAFVCIIVPRTNSVTLFAYHICDGRKRLFHNTSFKIEDVENEIWYKRMLKSRRGEVVELDFSKENDLEIAKGIIPQVYRVKDEFDIRGARVNYLTVNEKPWGFIGALVEGEPIMKLTKNERSLLDMVAYIIEIAISRRLTLIELQDAMEKANVAAKTKSNFLAIMSHEIRTPLNAVLGFTDLLKEPRLDEITRKEYLANIAVAGNSLLSLINDILDLSKLTANKMDFAPTESSLLDVISQLGMLFRPKCNLKGLRFIGIVPRKFPSVWIDARRVKQILFNLVGNAVKFTKKGSVSVSAEFTKDNDKEGTLIISVKDTGIGISEEDKANIFNPFEQASRIRGTVTSNNGTGLGLAISKTMAECMSGELTLESSLGKGSTFILTLKNVKFIDNNAEFHLEKVEKNKDEFKDFSKYSVLIVDDVALNLMVLKSLLKRLNITATTATNATEALAEIKNQHFDFVLTDLWMPGLNGVELAQCIRREIKKNPPRIGVVTADVDADKHFDFSVFDAVLTKPVTLHSIQSFFEQKKH